MNDGPAQDSNPELSLTWQIHTAIVQRPSREGETHRRIEKKKQRERTRQMFHRDITERLNLTFRLC